MAYSPTPAWTAEEEAYQYIQRRIRMGQFRASARLVPEAIAAEIGTSRMPVRGALRRLASEGLVEIRANRGAIVRGLNEREMVEAFEMRAVLEGLAARHAVIAMRPAHIRRLVDMLDQMERGAEYLDWTTAHRDFHE